MQHGSLHDFAVNATKGRRRGRGLVLELLLGLLSHVYSFYLRRDRSGDLVGVGLYHATS